MPLHVVAIVVSGDRTKRVNRTVGVVLGCQFDLWPQATRGSVQENPQSTQLKAWPKPKPDHVAH